MKAHVLFSLLLLPLCALAAPELGVNPEAHRTPGRDATASEIGAAKERASYAESARRTLDRFDGQVAQVRRERDGLDENATKYRLLDMRVHALDAKLGEARANLRSLERADPWTGYRARIDRNVTELYDIMGRRLAE